MFGSRIGAQAESGRENKLLELGRFWKACAASRGCIFGCILDAECARTTQPTPTRRTFLVVTIRKALWKYWCRRSHRQRICVTDIFGAETYKGCGKEAGCKEHERSTRRSRNGEARRLSSRRQEVSTHRSSRPKNTPRFIVSTPLSANFEATSINGNGHGYLHLPFATGAIGNANPLHFGPG